MVFNNEQKLKENLGKGELRLNFQTIIYYGQYGLTNQKRLNEINISKGLLKKCNIPPTV